MTFIPYSRQHINEMDIDAVVQVLRSDLITQGKVVPAFEQKVANYCGAKYAIAVSSATAGLQTACAALGADKNSRIWTSPNSFVASANAGRYLGSAIDFVDIEQSTGNISLAKLKKKLEQAEQKKLLPDILIVVHFAGRGCDMENIASLCRPYGIKIIEDAAHALGAEEFQGNTKIGCCQHSDVTVFSFHPVKPVTTGEGGMLVTNDATIADFAQSYRSHGITRDANKIDDLNDSHGAWYYEQQMLGYHFRLTDIQAALGLSQMDRLDEFIARRRAVAGRYNHLLKDFPVILPPLSDKSGWHLYVIQIDNTRTTTTRKQVFDYLRKNNIGVNVHYIPIHTQPYYQELGFGWGDFPDAESYYSVVLSLPVFPELTEAEQLYVVQMLQEALDA